MSAIRIFAGLGSSGQNRRPEKVPNEAVKTIHMKSGTRLAARQQFPGGVRGAPASARAPALAGRKLAQLFFHPSGKDHGAQRSGPRPENEVFALRHKTGTGQCLVAVTGTSLSTVGVFGFAQSNGSDASNLAGTGLGGPGRHLDRRLACNFRRRRRAVRALLPGRLRRSLRLQAPSPSASGQSAADAPGPPIHRVAPRGVRRCRRTASYTAAPPAAWSNLTLSSVPMCFLFHIFHIGVFAGYTLVPESGVKMTAFRVGGASPCGFSPACHWPSPVASATP